MSAVTMAQERLAEGGGECHRCPRILQVLLAVLLIAVSVMVSGCGHMPITSIYKLRNFDPATTDISQLRVGVRLPEAFRLRPDGVQLIAAAQDKTGRQLRKEVFKLRPVTSANERALLGAHRRLGTSIYAYHLSSRDIARFNQIRQFIKAGKPQGIGGSLGVDTDACRTTKQRPDKIPVSTFIMSSETQEFVPLVVDFDLLSNFDRKEIHKAIPVCVSN